MTSWPLPVTLIAALVGGMLAVQFRTQKAVEEALPSRRVEELVFLLKEARAEHGRLASELNARRHGGPHPNAAGLARTGSPRWGALAGPGVLVKVDDSDKAVARGENPNLALVHNEDLLRIANELRAAGAEAVAINDQRLVEGSEVSCAGPTILVNQTRLVPPFEVRALGDPDTLGKALALRGGVVEYLRGYGIQVAVNASPRLVLPAFQGGARRRYARAPRADGAASGPLGEGGATSEAFASPVASSGGGR